MQYQHTIVYRIKGLIHDGPSVPVARDEALDLNVTIGADPDEALLHDDRATVLIGLMLSATLSRLEDSARRELLESRVADIREQRRRSGRDAFLIVSREGKLESYTPTTALEFSEYAVWIDGGPKLAIRLETRAAVRRIVSSVFLSVDALSIDKIADSIVYFAKARPIYALDFTASMGSVYSSVAAPSDAYAAIQGRYERLMVAGNLDRVIHLCIASFEADADQLRSFLTAWAALEVFVRKTFSTFKSRFFAQVGSAVHDAIDRTLLRRIEEVTRDKFGIVHMFALVAAELSPDTANVDVDIFKRLKKHRDELHTEDIGNRQLPTQDARILVRRYLAAFLQWTPSTPERQK